MFVKSMKNFIKGNKFLFFTIFVPIKFFRDMRLYILTKKLINDKSNAKKKIFYFGIPAHANLGDLAQGVCIRNWIKKNYPSYTIIEIETNAVVHTSFPLIKYIKQIYRTCDFIVFQSGYTTTDLGGFADEMHRLVINTFPDAKILMMPQTIFFKDEKNKIRTSQTYNIAKSMLFLARDRISYNEAKIMFPDIEVKLYPDIVTTIIGKKSFDYKRDGILFCCRDDSEKYYSDDEIHNLIEKCSKLCSVQRSDTTKQRGKTKIITNAEKYINQEIEEYSHYRLIITDRYHGTILSLAASTPVIIIKTTDHKVITGAEWFKGIYDDYVYVVDSLENAYEKAEELLNKDFNHILAPYFEEEFYDKLSLIFKEQNNDCTG